MQAIVPYNVEVRSGRFCCCDSQICNGSLTALVGCSNEAQKCELEVTMFLSDCKSCPSVCCHVYEFGNKSSTTISDVLFQINGEPSGRVSNCGNVMIIRYFCMSQEHYIAGYIWLCVLSYG